MAAPRGSLGEDLAAQPEEAPVLPVAAAMAAAQRALGDAVHADARAAYATQRALEEECREARDAARRFAAAAARWRKEVGQFDAALRTMGDVDNWAACVAADVATVAKTLEKVAAKNADAGGSLGRQ